MAEPLLDTRQKEVMLLSNRIGVISGQTGGGSIMREKLSIAVESELNCKLQRVDAAVLHHIESVFPPPGPILTLCMSNLSKLWRMVGEADLAIVSGSFTPLSPWCCFFCALRRRPVLVIITSDMQSFLHQSGLSGASRSLFIWMCNASDWLCCVFATCRVSRSVEFQRTLEARLGLPFDGVLGVAQQYSNFLMEDSDATIKAARAALAPGAPTDRPLLLFAGRLAPEKRIHLVVAAKPLSMSLAIVGGVEPGFEEVLAFHNPAEGIYVHPARVSQSELRVFYKAADVHISASNSETLGNTVHESLLCGTPVVVQAAGGYLSQVTDGQNGFLVDFEDIKAVASCLDKACGGALLGPIKPTMTGAKQASDIVAPLLTELAVSGSTFLQLSPMMWLRFSTRCCYLFGVSMMAIIYQRAAARM